jgi:hypothetical protein
VGDVQAPKGAPSILHWKEERASEEEKAKVAEALLVNPQGAAVMVVSGGAVVSQAPGARLAATSAWPAPSLAA